jgi:hypothetical protein
MVLSAEIIRVLLQPTRLAPALAGLPAGGLEAKTLMIAIAVIGQKQLLAMKTLALAA